VKYIQQLNQLLRDNGTTEYYYTLFDKTGHVKYGGGGGVYQIKYRPETEKWTALIHEVGRADFYVQGEYDTSREACIKFLEMSDVELHLASHIPEFEEQAA